MARYWLPHILWTDVREKRLRYLVVQSNLIDNVKNTVYSVRKILIMSKVNENPVFVEVTLLFFKNGGMRREHVRELSGVRDVM